MVDISTASTVRSVFLVLGVLAVLWFVYALLVMRHLVFGIVPGLLVAVGYLIWRS